MSERFGLRKWFEHPRGAPEMWTLYDSVGQGKDLSRESGEELRDLLAANFPIPTTFRLGEPIDVTNRERRERIATAVLAGFAAGWSRNEGGSASTLAFTAACWADALIATLDRP